METQFLGKHLVKVMEIFCLRFCTDCILQRSLFYMAKSIGDFDLCVLCQYLSPNSPPFYEGTRCIKKRFPVNQV